MSSVTLFRLLLAQLIAGIAGQRLTMAGSFVQPVQASLGPAAVDAEVSVTVSVRRPTPLPDANGPIIDRDTFATIYGMAPDDLAAIEAFAESEGLTVTEVRVAACTVTLSGTVAQMQAAFGVSLNVYSDSYGDDYHAPTSAPSVPNSVAGIITNVMGLSTRAIVQRAGQILMRVTPQALTPPQVAALYNFPSGTGAGVTIGIVEYGGGYFDSDNTAFFTGLGLPTPTVISYSVDGATNNPWRTSTTLNSADGEVALDIQVAGGVAPGAKIVVYFAPNSEQGFYDAFAAAINDNVNNPTVISCSWGLNDGLWPASFENALNNLLQAGTALGVTSISASGDHANGGTAMFPSTASYMLGVGGTQLIGSGSTISSETVWNTNGGGQSQGGPSTVFSLPSYQSAQMLVTRIGQSGVGLTQRGTPDVAANSDPYSGYKVIIHGSTAQYGGTSAGAPLWAGLVALITQNVGHPLGLLQPFISSATSRDITVGNNNVYTATVGWDAVTGWGSPNGVALQNSVINGGPVTGSPTGTGSVTSTFSLTPTKTRSPSQTSTMSRSSSSSPSGSGSSRLASPSRPASKTPTASKSSQASKSSTKSPTRARHNDLGVTATADASPSVSVDPSPSASPSVSVSVAVSVSAVVAPPASTTASLSAARSVTPAGVSVTSVIGATSSATGTSTRTPVGYAKVDGAAAGTGSSGGTIAGAVVGAIAGAALIAGVVVLVRGRCMPTDAKTLDDGTKDFSDGASMSTSTTSGGTNSRSTRTSAYTGTTYTGTTTSYTGVTYTGTGYTTTGASSYFTNSTYSV